MSAKPKLTVLKADALPFEERAARVLGVERLPALPTPRDEAFHYTNLRAISGLKPHRGADWELAEIARLLPVVDGPQVVVVNGRVVPQLTLLEGLKGVTVGWEGVHPSPAPATALQAWHVAQGGQVMEIEASEGSAVLHIMQVVAGDTPTGGMVRVRVADGAAFTLVEHVVGSDEAGWLNDRVMVDVASGGSFTHVLVQVMPCMSAFTRREDVDVAENGTYTTFTLNKGGMLARVEREVSAGATCTLKMTGLTLTDAGQTHDTTVRVNHMDVGTGTHIRQRNILRGVGSHAVFQGKFYVAQKAQKTDAYMLCESLLLEEGARVSAKPELEIYADDVKCSHGASTGSLQHDQLFYLAARGVPEAAAKRLLIAAFADELLEDVPDAAKGLVSKRVNAWLDGEVSLPALDEAEPDTEWLQ